VNPPLLKRVVADAVGTALLLAAVVGSGIMGQRLAAVTHGDRAVSERARYESGSRRADFNVWLAPSLPVAADSVLLKPSMESRHE